MFFMACDKHHRSDLSHNPDAGLMQGIGRQRKVQGLESDLLGLSYGLSKYVALGILLSLSVPQFLFI